MSVPVELEAVARRVVWFKAPTDALVDKAFFLTHVMTYGTIEDIAIARRYFSAADFKTALDAAPCGVFDPRSWAYWNTVFHRLPVPPLPRRRIVAATPTATQEHPRPRPENDSDLER